jgi:type II secretory pathway pseudopilin PulG
MHRRHESAFTLVELLVVILVIFTLASIAYPTYTSVTARARATQDLNNLRQIGIAMQTYLNDNDQVIPASGTWPGTSAAPALYPKYLGIRKVLQSPFDKRTSSEATDGTAPVSYGINTNMYSPTGVNRNMASVVSATSTIFMAPNYTGDPTPSGSWTGTTGNAPDLPAGAPAETTGTQSNARQINALFCDVHVETLTFGPASRAGSFQDTTSYPLGQKHWDPTIK